MLYQILQAKNGNSNRVVAMENQKTYTYSQLFELATKMSQLLLDSGVRNGQRIVLLTDHDLLGVIFLASASMLALEVVLKYNLSSLKPKELKASLSSYRFDHIVFLKKNEDELCKIRKNGFSTIAYSLTELCKVPATNIKINVSKKPKKNFLILYTSGSTGQPKAISISEALVCKRVASVSKQLRFSAQSKVLLSGLLTNTTGIIFSFGSFLNGSLLIVPPNHDVCFWPKYIKKLKVTHLMLRPAAMKIFLDFSEAHKLFFPDVEVMAYGAASLSASVLERGRNILKCDWIQGYGLSETFGPFSWLFEEDHLKKTYNKYVYNIGRPDSTLLISIKSKTKENIGKIKINGANLMNGYYNSDLSQVLPQENSFTTSDIGFFSSEGYLVLRGRENDFFLTENGHSVSPMEVERSFQNLSEVEESMLFDDVHPITLVSKTVICLKLRADIDTNKIELFEKYLLDNLENEISREKCPDYFVLFDDAFPLLENGKVDRKLTLAKIREKKWIALKRRKRDD